MSQTNIPNIYNPRNMTSRQLIENFVVRLDIFREIFDDIKSSKMQHPEQNFIIQGIRGQGKTTLLLRVAYEIENDPELNQLLIPVKFSEEQYHIRKLYNLWESTAEYISSYKGFEDLPDKMQEIKFDDDYEIRCFRLLEKFLKQNRKKLVLFIDNIDAIFNKFSKKEHHRLREVLIESTEFRIIGASAVSLEFHYDYGKPFYEFFRMLLLKGLNREETKTLLLSLGRHYKQTQIERIIRDQPGRVEALRRITSGVIRTIIILYSIFADEEEGNAFQDLEDTLDKVTTLYKHRMDSLSPQQQEIMDFIALSWDAVSTKEIAQKTRIESKAVSAQLKFLQKNHLIEQQATSTKNHLYRLSERFFNIWYLMRHGRKREENRVRFLVEFLQIWCDDKEITNRTHKQTEAIQKGKIYEKQALYMSEALACAIEDRKLQDRLVKQARSYLQNRNPELLNDLSDSDDELKEKAIQLIEGQKDKESAIQNLEKIKHKEIDELRMLADYYFLDFKKPKKAKMYSLMAIEKGDTESIFNLALLYQTEFKDFKNAEKYYLMAVDKDNDSAMVNLALLFEIEFKDFKKAKKYYLMAVGKGNDMAMFNLAQLYKTEFKDFKNAEKYYLMAVGKGNDLALVGLALLYQTEFKDFKKAEKYYLMAVNKGSDDAMNNLAWMYYENKVNRNEALLYSEKGFLRDNSIYRAHTYAVILLWNDQIDKALEVAGVFLENEDAYINFTSDIRDFLILLIAKKQYHETLKIFNENPFDLKERYKPVYYALMNFLKDDYPNEYRKMGSELKETVDEIIERINQMAKDYK